MLAPKNAKQTNQWLKQLGKDCPSLFTGSLVPTKHCFYEVHFKWNISHINCDFFFFSCNMFTGNVNCFEVCKTDTCKHKEKLCLFAMMWAQSKITVNKDIWQRFWLHNAVAVPLGCRVKRALAQFLHPCCCELQQRVTVWEDEGQTIVGLPAHIITHWSIATAKHDASNPAREDETFVSRGKNRYDQDADQLLVKLNGWLLGERESIPEHRSSDCS